MIVGLAQSSLLLNTAMSGNKKMFSGSVITKSAQFKQLSTLSGII
jgi:hypothetical protein